MADLDRNIRGADVFQGFARMEPDARTDSAFQDIETVSKVEMLLVGSGGLMSAAIVALGLWKLVELVA
ncbi:hypothetical protein [Parvibaculum sp.]|uniref:hypothetical protein n=1 Tax=Parvibaculum sp. TaxID=2024848 RepID=UPI003298BC7F